jgi:hypothetical protein
MSKYCDRDLLKRALSLPATATGGHAALDAVLEGVSREIDEYVGFRFYTTSGVRHYRPRCSNYLALDYPLTAVDSVTLDTDGDSSYESTLESTGYYTTPDNATEEGKPWWGLELRAGAAASCAFPVGVQRGAKITGAWGYYNQREETTAKPATGIDATQSVWDMAGASDLHPGQTLRVDSEQVLILDNALSGSATAATSGQLTVKRGCNGTSGTTHSSNSTMSVYVYPIVDRVALYQSEMDYRAQDAPLGPLADDQGGQSLRAPGGLHPFVRRQLDLFRSPVAR